ncbi:CBL-interacting serine/threonine-protein kinase 14-like [Phalaenopsis equestris]|uniref:CBL-interacting serine/threonine-protein kinase 14-like n=1 Tax=Phalaenopsis equestris TaxID=78828 RepID=UPI0009E608F0|nr:CBL-interacting serine/threonine-protein kinase 14-like [Phalaenopsis equestris]
MHSSGVAPPAASAKILFGKYEIGRLLGVGAFAKVYHARHIPLGHNVAIKIISKAKVIRSGLVVNTKREIVVMRRLRHPNIVRLLEVLASHSNIYFVMEYVKGGELFSHVSRGRLPEDQSRRFFHQLIFAVAFCHARGVFHRDLKPENLLLDDSGNLKVSDFGLSAVAEQIRSDGLFHTLCGTPAYVAPEILSRRGYEGAKVDIWSCGVILFVLNAGYLPFNDPNLMALYRKIYRGEYRCPRWISPELRQLLSRLLDTNPGTRITIEGILNDPWFRRGLEEGNMLKLMRFREDIEERISRVERENEEDDDRDLNAFDIISLNPRFNLSGFFNPTVEALQRFISAGPVEAVLERVETVGREEGLVVRRRLRGFKGRGSAAVQGRMGALIAWVDVFRLSPELVMVEVERGGGMEAAKWNVEFWRGRLAAAIRGSVRPASRRHRSARG